MCDLGSDSRTVRQCFLLFLAIHVWFHYGNSRKPIDVESVCLMMKILVPFPYTMLLFLSPLILSQLYHVQNDVSKVSSFLCVCPQKGKKRENLIMENQLLDFIIEHSHSQPLAQRCWCWPYPTPPGYQATVSAGPLMVLLSHWLVPQWAPPSKPPLLRSDLGDAV